MKRLGKKGFTLVEIMIVVAIIALLAAIAIPNLLRARHNANETAGIASLRTISTAMESWRAGKTPATYAGASLVNLAGAIPPYIDGALGASDPSKKQGYIFTLTIIAGTGNQQYTCAAHAEVYHTTGTRAFIVDESGVIRAGDVGSGVDLAKGAGSVIE